MSVPQLIKALNRKVPAAPPKALPVVTFTDEVSFHLDGETISARHVGPAHTDGDSVIRFETANVIHTGDVFINGAYPFVDISSGGSIDGFITATQKLLDMCDDKTKIIPGHGPLGNRADLARFHAMLKGVRAAVAQAMKTHQTMAAVIKSKPTAPWNKTWGQRFIKSDRMVELVYMSLSKKEP